MDNLDARLIAALKVDGRAPLRRIAEVLGVSDQQIGRRYASLHARGVLRVRGRRDPRRTNQSEWVIRLRCVPSAARHVAEALAQREDVHWVRLVSGGTEIVANIDTHSEQDHEQLLLEQLPASRRVTHISAHRVLQRYRGGPLVWLAPAGVLTTYQIEQLSLPVDTDSTPPTALREEDYALFEQLAHDGRATHALLASALDRDESTVRRRIHQLRSSGSLYFDIELDERQLGYTHNTILWLSVAPDRLPDVGQSLSRLPEIAYAAAVTGNRNIVASLLCTGDDHLYSFITERIGGLEGVTSVDTAPIISIVKRIGNPPSPSKAG